MDSSNIGLSGRKVWPVLVPFSPTSARDVAGSHFLYLLSGIGVHSQNSAHSFFVAGGSIVNVRTGVKNSGINAKINKRWPTKRIVLQFESQSRQRLVVFGAHPLFPASVLGRPLYGPVYRTATEIIRHGASKVNCAFVLQSGTAEYRHQFIADNGLPQSFL